MEFIEKPQKIWAIQTDQEVTAENLQKILRYSFHGLAHTADLAQRRLKQSIEALRPSHQRMYERSFVEATRASGALAVIAYGQCYNYQPSAWLVEAFVGDNLEPEVRTLPWLHANPFGIDVEDMHSLEEMMDSWFPAE